MAFLIAFQEDFGRTHLRLEVTPPCFQRNFIVLLFKEICCSLDHFSMKASIFCSHFFMYLFLLRLSMLILEYGFGCLCLWLCLCITFRVIFQLLSLFALRFVDVEFCVINWEARLQRSSFSAFIILRQSGHLSQTKIVILNIGIMWKIFLIKIDTVLSKLKV